MFYTNMKLNRTPHTHNIYIYNDHDLARSKWWILWGSSQHGLARLFSLVYYDLYWFISNVQWILSILVNPSQMNVNFMWIGCNISHEIWDSGRSRCCVIRSCFNGNMDPNFLRTMRANFFRCCVLCNYWNLLMEYMYTFIMHDYSLMYVWVNS